MNKPIIKVNNLNVAYAGNEVLKDVTVEFEKGETVLMAGRNGAGKSTFLKCLAGMILPDKGDITFFDGIGKQHTGAIIDKMSLYENVTLKEGIDFHSRVFNIETFDYSLMEQLNLNLKKTIRSLSSGERCLYHLSLLMSQKPAILLVDEVIHSVDPYLRELFLENVIEMIDQYDTTLLMVNHTFSEMGRLPERVMIMEEGTFILDEKREELDAKIKKIVTDKDITGDLPVIFKKDSQLYKEYYIYPFKEEYRSEYSCEFSEADLTEIVKSFIGGYYAKKRI